MHKSQQTLEEIVSTGDLPVLLAIWQESLLDEQGKEVRDFINARSEEIATINRLRTPFQDTCKGKGEEKFTTFRQVVEAYDARYLLRTLEENPQEVLRYLQETKGTYIPALLVRVLCAYNPEEGKEEVLAEMLVQCLLRLASHFYLLREVWRPFLERTKSVKVKLDEFGEEMGWPLTFVRVAEILQERKKKILICFIDCVHDC